MAGSNLLFETTDVYATNEMYLLDYKIIINQGGTYSTKTYSIMQLLLKIAFECKRFKHKVITIVGQDIPNIKVGVLRDCQNIISKSEVLNGAIKSYNRSDRIYEFNNGFKIEFKSYDDWQDAKSGKRDYLFINEANGIEFKVYEQLALRTEFNIFIDYNPDTEFWAHFKLRGKPGVKLIISDHRHNTFLSREQHNRIENIEDPELWKVYARGLTGKLEGVIFRYDVIQDIPEGAKYIGTGLDFGFTNDPTAAVDVYTIHDWLIIDEILYKQGLTNVPIHGVSEQVPNVSDELLSAGKFKSSTDIVADSAEPKSISELSQVGWYIEGANKGKDSVRAGIDIMKRFKIKLTYRSFNAKKEFNTYKWKQDKLSGQLLNTPVDFNNHAIDAAKYVCLNKLNFSGEEDYDNYFN